MEILCPEVQCHTVSPGFASGPSGRRRLVGMRKKRPSVITALALFELSKAGLLLFLLVIVIAHRDALASAGSSLRLLVALATNHIVTARSDLSGGSAAVTLFFPFYAVVCAVLGCGMWFMWGWARTALMWLSGIYIVRYLEALAFWDWIWHTPTISANGTFTVFAMVDALVLMCLVQERDAFRGST